MATKTLKIKKIVAENRAINSEQFAEAVRLLGKLRAHGVATPSYDLSSPFDRQMRSVDPLVLVTNSARAAHCGHGAASGGA